jgi:hemolysin III
MGWFNFREPVSAWTHFAWLVLAPPGTWLLWRRSRGDRVKQVGMLLFGLGLVACYAGSTLYHAVRLSPATIHHFNVLDHAAIYVLIAATVTPIGLVMLRGSWRAGFLGVMWGLAAVGIVLCVTEVPMPRWLSSAYYLLMGWFGCVTFSELVALVSLAALRPLWVGGLFYSVGALIHLARWPSLWPGVFGAHQLFHIFVMAGTLCHYGFMLAVLAPFRHPAACRERARPCCPLPAS